MTPVVVSIVCATYGRAAALRRLLDELDRPYDAPGQVELVVVDDASTDETPTVLAQAQLEHVHLIALRLQRNAGPATARNAGWRAARGDLVLFTDDDCVPAATWVCAMVEALRHADVVQGRTEPDPGALPSRGPFSHTLTSDPTADRFETCNVGYRRSVLEQTGGFDEGFRHPYGEDIDLGWRARAAGARVARAPDALVHHDVSPSSYRARLRRALREEGVVQVVARHPGYRSELHGRLWAKGSHPPALLAAAGLAAATSRRDAAGVALAGAAIAPYLYHRIVVAPLWRRRTWPITIPLSLLADLVEVGVLVRASWRHRTLVL